MAHETNFLALVHRSFDSAAALTKHTRGLLRHRVGDIKAVDDITFTIKKHETLGLVGESGCGKTTAGRCILRLYKPSSGTIDFDGTDISQLPERKMKPLRRNMGAAAARHVARHHDLEQNYLALEASLRGLAPDRGRCA